MGREPPARADLPGGGDPGGFPAGHPAQKGWLTAMQIRLTVLAPRGGQSAPAARPCDVIVTAPAGTALAAVASGLAAAVSGPDVSGTVVLYAGQERLDPQRRTLGEPPLVDGAVLSLQTPAEDETHEGEVSAQLHVVAGPDAGGVHLLHGGRISIGRSADADVPLDDPDVSRLHCAVTLADDGRVTVTDLGSTNGTTVDGAPVHARPVRLPSGALLRLGESTLRLSPGAPAPALPTAPDGEGHLRVPGPSSASVDGRPAPGPGGSAGAYEAGSTGPFLHGTRPVPSWASAGSPDDTPPAGTDRSHRAPDGGRAARPYRPDPTVAPAHGHAGGACRAAAAPAYGDSSRTHHMHAPLADDPAPRVPAQYAYDAHDRVPDRPGEASPERAPARGTDEPAEAPRRRGIG
ncbi:FHA domain-containing protein, partial [Streptomyces sp. NPDC054847]